MSSEKNAFKKISMGVILKYVGVSVDAKMPVKFRVSTREIPKNRSKFTKNAIFDLFWFTVHKRFGALGLLCVLLRILRRIKNGIACQYSGHANLLPMHVKVKFFQKLLNFEAFQKANE